MFAIAFVLFALGGPVGDSAHGGSRGAEMCGSLGGACSESSECCDSANGVDCQGGSCCLKSGATCDPNAAVSHCCTRQACGANGACP